MELGDKIKKIENLHVILWLIKDTCWMLEQKWLGAIMMVPTLFFALFIVYRTLKTNDVYINLAIFFWISANSFWMMMEFFNHNLYKNFAIIPFGLGFLFVAIFYIKTFINKRQVS